MLVSILTFELAFLAIGISFNVPVSQHLTINLLFTDPIEPINSTDNYSISIVDELVMGLHPNIHTIQ
jgi:hypothetical protein